MKNNELYVSIDIEADGKIPGLSSMINFGAVFYDNYGAELGTYEANLEHLEPPARPDPSTKKWWDLQFSKNLDLERKLNTNVRHPSVVIPEFLKLSDMWCKSFNAPITPLAYPAGFDWTFMYYYLVMFGPYGSPAPYTFSCLDIKTYAMAAMKEVDYRNVVKRYMPKSWFNKKLRHTHDGLDDARGQGYLFFSIRDQIHEA